MGCLCSTAPKLDNKDDMLDDLPEDFSHKDTTNADFGTWLDKQPLWSKIVYPLICVLVSAVLIYIGYRIFHKSEDITLRGGLTEAEFKHYEDQKTQIDPEAGCHLFVLSHGLNDSPSGLAYLAKRLIHNLQRPSDSHSCDHHEHSIVVLNLDVNVGQTKGGIHSGGVRAKKEIAKYLSENPCIKLVSAIGHSLGGMYLRVAFGELLGSKVMDGIHLVNYVSFASPHLGSLDFRRLFGTPLANFGVTSWARQTGREMMLKDTNPFLLRMTKGKYLDALEAFAKRIAVANIANDTSVSFRSATMLRENFYKAYKSQFKSRLPALAYNSRILDRARVLADMVQSDRYYTENFPKANTKNEDLKLEQQMIENLNKLEWNRVDCFGRPLFAHTDIVVKSERFNNGHKIVEHVISLLQV
eukprot:516895_1